MQTEDGVATQVWCKVTAGAASWPGARSEGGRVRAAFGCSVPAKG